jgi:dihydrofolate reductase
MIRGEVAAADEPSGGCGDPVRHRVIVENTRSAKGRECWMARVVVMNHVSLDGVMQGPGRADEDTRDGFTLGGWAMSDDAAGQAMGERMTAGGGFAGWLLGRRTYEEVLGHWTQQPDSPFGALLVDAHKYVASTTLVDPLPWPNSTLLQGDAADAVARLKSEVDGVLAIMGSGRLIESLLPHDLVDELLVMTHPCVLGSGRRLFPDGVPPARFECLGAGATPKGIVIATYTLLGSR